MVMVMVHNKNPEKQRYAENKLLPKQQNDSNDIINKINGLPEPYTVVRR